MSKSLVIVESPAKARTINKFLGKDYLVKASYGHVKDLPKNRLGIDIEGGFIPHYEIIKGKKKIILDLKKTAKEVFKSGGRVFLAQDPDREGEAIAWHIAEELNGNNPNTYRVLFHEITKDAIREAIENPLRLDKRKYDAQVARRILDRLVGYKVSPLLWEKVRRGLSAGRVQSVALRLICEREKEIASFKPEEYWSIKGEFSAPEPPVFVGKLIRIGRKKAELKNKGDAEHVVDDLKGGEFSISSVERKERQKTPPPPFITSTLQQVASRMLRFTVKKTMMIAQQLYEGIELGEEGAVGLITYMRTDSTRLSNMAVNEARRYIKERYGSDFVPEKPRIYPNKKTAQDAHEAIRPTSMRYSPEYVKPHLTADQFRLYELIWNRFLACQMRPAVFDQTIVTIEGRGRSSKKYIFQAVGSVMKFPGFTVLYKDQEEESPEEGGILPPLRSEDRVTLLRLLPKQHFTQPPPRYSEGTLVKALEEKGIGRPSTYAVILSTIQARDYVRKERGRFIPTDLGMLVTDLLVENFPRILNVDFTARMEEDLDSIEEGKSTWRNTIEEFYTQFEEQLARAKKEMRNVKSEETPTELECERCGGRMVIRWGRNGRFLACSNYPECSNTKDFVSDANGKVKVVENDSGEICPSCGEPMLIKEGRFGRFLACSAYPGCKTTKPLSTGVRCPVDGCTGTLVERRSRKGRTFFSCSEYPRCRYSIWDRPIDDRCPECGHPFLVARERKRVSSLSAEDHDTALVCPNKECGFKKASGS